MSKVVRFESSYEEKYPLEVSGESHHRDAIESLFGYVDDEGVNEDGLTAHLILDNTNINDHNAVRVEIDDQLVGYLPRKAAKIYREKLNGLGLSDIIGECTASIRGGYLIKKGDRAGEQADYGIRLDVDLENLQIAREGRKVVQPIQATSSPDISISQKPKISAPILGNKNPKRKWKTWQIGAAVVVGLIFCGCAGFWALWLLAKLSGY